MKAILICASLIMAGAAPTMAQSEMPAMTSNAHCQMEMGKFHQMPATAKNRPGYRMAGSYMTATGEVPQTEQASFAGMGANCPAAMGMAPMHRMPAGAKNKAGEVMPGESMAH